MSSPQQFALQLSNGQQTFSVAGEATPAQQITFACLAYPSAGTISLEYQFAGDTTNWRTAPKSTARPLAGPLVFETFGPAVRFRATLAGITGGNGLIAIVSEADPQGFPARAFEGYRALTIQHYIEANVKNGSQFEASAYVAALAPGANNDTVFITGAKPVLIKARQISFDGIKLEARLYRAPAYSGGVAVPYYNLNTRNPATGLAQIKGGATVSDVGTEIGAPSFMVGSDGQGQSTLGTYAVAGNERLLAANTEFLLRITNTDAAPQQVAVYVTWYEGDTDLPLQ